MDKLNLTFLISLFLFSNIFSSGVTAEGIQTEEKKVIWSCKKLYSKEHILWLVEWGDKSYIKVFDERILAFYKMDGLEKRWNWDLDGISRTYNYAITLDPDLTASYYDLSISSDGTAKSKATYKCKK
jgi:hypothetical protein